jgi:thiol:disulfide interchange protein DsbC
MNLIRFAVIATALSICVAPVGAQQPAAPTKPAVKVEPKPVDPRALIAKKIDDVKIEDVRLSPVPGVYEIARQSMVAYVTADARYVIAGDLYDLDTDANLTEVRRRGIRQKMLGSVPATEMIAFGPKDAKHWVTVFTDIDCGYCQRMHSQIAEYNRLGIGINYLLYPRSGPDSESWRKAEQVWCAPNRQDALTRAKRGENVKSPKCATGVIQRDWELGQDLMIRGTPAIVLANGDLQPGYLPPAGLAAKIRESAR